MNFSNKIGDSMVANEGMILRLLRKVIHSFRK